MRVFQNLQITTLSSVYVKSENPQHIINLISWPSPGRLYGLGEMKKIFDDKDFVEKEVIQLIKKVLMEWNNIQKINIKELGIGIRFIKKKKQEKTNNDSSR